MNYTNLDEAFTSTVNSLEQTLDVANGDRIINLQNTVFKLKKCPHCARNNEVHSISTTYDGNRTQKCAKHGVIFQA
jgi:hypothetical protein